MPEGVEEEQEIENLFEKIMKEKFSNLAMELDLQVQDTQSPKQVVSKKKKEIKKTENENTLGHLLKCHHLNHRDDGRRRRRTRN